MVEGPRVGLTGPSVQRCRHAALRAACEPLPLTEQEREVVSLLGGGPSNRDVAGRLNLPVRTVEGHIYRAMTRTGTASRDELAALLPTDLFRPTAPPGQSAR